MQAVFDYQDAPVSLYAFEEHPHSSVLTAVISVLCCLIEACFEEYCSAPECVIKDVFDLLIRLIDNCDHIMLDRILTFFESILCNGVTPCANSPLFAQYQVRLHHSPYTQMCLTALLADMTLPGDLLEQTPSTEVQALRQRIGVG